jgi:beta-lactamase regulating signal transducer with metallopeptidase domain
MYNPLVDVSLGNTQASQPVTNLSPHVDGGPASARGAAGSNAASSADDKMCLHVACGIVLAAVLLLWVMGALVFSTARL